MRTWTWILAAAVALPIPGAAFAQPTDVHTQAEERAKEAIEARDKGDYRRALGLFRTSHGLEPGRGKLLNIALCEEELKMLAAAMEHFQEVLPQLTSKDTNDPRIPVVREHIAKLGPRISYLRINLAAGTPPNARVLLDAEPVSSAVLGGNWPVDPGKHILRVEAEGYSPATATVTVAVRKTETVNLTLERATTATSPPIGPVPPAAAPRPSSDAPPPPAPEASSSRPLRATMGFVGIGVGGAGLVMGAVAGGLTLVKNHSLSTNCAPAKGPNKDCTQATIDTYHLVGNVATAGLVVGGIMAATGIILVATAPRKGVSSEASIEMVIGPGYAGARGRF